MSLRPTESITVCSVVVVVSEVGVDVQEMQSISPAIAKNRFLTFIVILFLMRLSTENHSTFSPIKYVTRPNSYFF